MAAGSTGSPWPGLPPLALLRFTSASACAASQVSMSSGATSIRRSAPSMTFLNTGADTSPP